MKIIISIVCLIMVTMSSALAQQAKDIVNYKSNMKSFKSTAWLLPQPVLIIGTYDKEGKPNAMNAAWGGQWDMHEIIQAKDAYPDCVVVHRHGVRESGRRYVPEAIEADSSLRKAVEGLEGQVTVLQAENDALRTENKRLTADNVRMLLEIECLNVAGMVRAHIVDESTLDVQGVRFVRVGVDDAQR